MPQSRNEKQISNFIEVNGTGSIVLRDGTACDVFVYGYFTQQGRWFIVHRDIEDIRYLAVSEASTGARLIRENYYEVEDALYFARPFIDSKKLYFATAIGDTLVRTQKNLLQRNTTGLQTLAIDTALWM